MNNSNHGRWNEAAVRRIPRTGEGVWTGLRGRAYTYAIRQTEGQMRVDTVLGVVRRRGNNGWSARIEGFEWTITPDMGIARFQSVPSSSPLTHTPIKAFPTSKAAKAEVERIIAEARSWAV